MDIRRLAELSALYLTEEELVKAKKDLQQMLHFTALLSNLQPTKSEPQPEAILSSGQQANGKKAGCDLAARMLENAPCSIDGFFRIPNPKEEREDV